MSAPVKVALKSIAAPVDATAIVAKWVFTLTDSAGTPTTQELAAGLEVDADVAVDFPPVIEGAFTVSIQAFAADGSKVGLPSTGTDTVTPVGGTGGATLGVPGPLTITVGTPA